MTRSNDIPSLDFCLLDHLITLSARASTFGGIVTPICFAVFKLMTNSISSAAALAGLPALFP